MSALDESSHWLLDCTRDRFLELITQPGFACLLRLARHVNALRFGQAALNHAQDDDGPIGLRSRPGAFFYHGGVLFEALQLVPELRVHFAANPHWERSFGRFGTDDEVRALYAQGTDLHRLRNHVGFHVLGIVPERSLPTLNLPDYVLARGIGRSVGKTYYELADTVALHYLLGAPEDFEAFIAAFEKRGAKVTALLVSFLEASDILLPRAFEALGIRPRIIPPPDDDVAA